MGNIPHLSASLCKMEVYFQNDLELFMLLMLLVQRTNFSETLVNGFQL